MTDKLAITEEQFNELYPDLVGKYHHYDKPVPPGTSTETFEQQYLRSKLWRLNNIYTVLNKQGQPVKFRMNYAQHRVYAASRKHPRLIILKSRQQGISTFWLVSYFDDALFCPHLNIGLMAQGTDEASTLLERVKFLWENLSSDIKAFARVALSKDNAKAYALDNGSTLFIRVSFRSATLQRLHVSEFGKIANAYPQRAKEVKTGTLQALAKGNTGVIESTAEGKNEFKYMWDSAVQVVQTGTLTPKDFYPVFLSWLDDPDCALDIQQVIDNEASEYFAKLETETGRKLTDQQKNFWVAQKRELGGDIFQEYPATPEEAFTAAKDGTYYSRAYNEHVVRRHKLIPKLYDPNLPVDVYFDLGVDDYTVVGYTQWYRGAYRLIDEDWNNGYDLEFYIDEAKRRGYNIRSFVFPHDLKQRQLLSGKSQGGRARTKYDIIREYIKEHFPRAHIHVLAKSDVEDGIEAVRRMIPMLEVDPKCTYLISCFLNYSKEYDEKLGVWKRTPLHDEFSHGADMLRCWAVGNLESLEHHQSKLETPKPKQANRGYDV